MTRSGRQWLLWRVFAVASAVLAVGDLCWAVWLVGPDILRVGVPLGLYLVFAALWAIVAVWGLIAFRRRPWFWAWLGITGWNAILVAIFPLFSRLAIAMMA